MQQDNDKTLESRARVRMEISIKKGSKPEDGYLAIMVGKKGVGNGTPNCRRWIKR